MGFFKSYSEKEVKRVMPLVKKINELEAKIMFVVLDTILSMVMFSTVDYFMKSVSATPISLFIVSLVMSLLCMNDVIEKKDR